MRLLLCTCLVATIAATTGCARVHAFFQSGYKSTAVIQVSGAGSNVEMTDAVNTLATTVLSRVSLVELIRNAGIYKDELQHMPVEDVIEVMRREITISPVSAPGGMMGMEITFTHPDPVVAQRITQELTNRFIDANVRGTAPLQLKVIEPASLPTA